MTLGKQHVGMRMTKGNLARAYAFCGRCVDAESALLDVLDGVDDNHPDWFECMYGYVRIETQLGHIAEAEKTCQTMLRKVMSDGTKSPRFRLTLELLANIYLRSGQAEQLSLLRKRHTWMNVDNIERPSLFL